MSELPKWVKSAAIEYVDKTHILEEGVQETDVTAYADFIAGARLVLEKLAATAEKDPKNFSEPDDVVPFSYRKGRASVRKEVLDE